MRGKRDALRALPAYASVLAAAAVATEGASAFRGALESKVSGARDAVT